MHCLPLEEAGEPSAGVLHDPGKGGGRQPGMYSERVFREVAAVTEEYRARPSRVFVFLPGVDFDCHVGAHNGAKCAANAFPGGGYKRGAVSSLRRFLSQGEEHPGAGGGAQTTPLAPRFVD